MSQFLTIDEARNWLHLYRNSPIEEPSEEDKEIDKNVMFLIEFAEGYLVHGVGKWILESSDKYILSKIKFLMNNILSDCYENKAFTEETATERTKKRYIVESTINQLLCLDPSYEKNESPLINNICPWDYI